MFGVKPDKLVTGVDGCGILTYAFRLREVAEAYAVLADPTALPASDPRSVFTADLVTIRDAMLAHPEMVAGSRDRLDTSLMKAADGGIVSKSGMEGLRGVGDPAGRARRRRRVRPAWRSRSRTATRAIGRRTRQRSRHSGRSARSMARRSDRLPATTGRRASIPTGRSWPRRSPSSSSRPSGSSSGEPLTGG